MQLTQQIKIKPTIAQKVVLETLSEKCRLIYNFALKERLEAFETQLYHVNYIKQQNDLPRLKKKYSEYKWVYSKVLQYTLRTLDADFKSYFALKKRENKLAKAPKFKNRKYFTTMVYNQSGFKHRKGYIELSHYHPTKLKLIFKIPDKFTFKKIYQISIYKKDEDFYLSITYEKTEKEYKDNGMYQAFDLGVMKHTAVNSKGRFIEIENQRPDKYWGKTTKELHSRRDRCKKFSNKWNQLNNNLKKVKRKISNQSKDFQHKASKKIIENTKANTIIVGKLETKKLASSKKSKYAKSLHKSLQNTGNLSRFVRFLTYKAKLLGKRTIKINERGTTKTCCVCGKIQDMPLYKRKYICDCGNNIDRDKNSAINILCRFLSQNAMWTGYQEFLGNL